MDVVRKQLLSARVSEIRRRRLRVPKYKPSYPKGIELTYAMALRRIQREINAELLSRLEPILSRMKQDTAEDIEAATDESWFDRFIRSGGDIRVLISSFALKMGEHNANKYSGLIWQLLGISGNSQDAEVSEVLRLWTIENIKLIQNINQVQSSKIETLLLRAMQGGQQVDDLTEEIQRAMSVTESRATLIARDQIGKLNSNLDLKKHTEAGFEYFFWRDSNDSRVRPTHQSRDGKRYRYDKPPNGEYPGQPVLCRCTMEPDFTALFNELGIDFGATTGSQRTSRKTVTKKTVARRPAKKRQAPQLARNPVRKVIKKQEYGIPEERSIPATGTALPSMPAPAAPARAIKAVDKNKPSKRSSMTAGRARKVGKLNDKQQLFDQNNRWINQNIKKNRKLANAEERVEWLQWEWVHGSNRKASVNFKAAAKKAFNLDGSVFNPHSLKIDLVDDMMIGDVKKLHKLTQNEFAEKGVKTVKLYRGVNTLYAQRGAIESWTSDLNMAKKFGKFVMETEVDVSRVLTHHKSSRWVDGVWGDQAEYLVMR